MVKIITNPQALLLFVCRNPSVSGIADSVAEYFGRNFSHVFDGGVQRHIAKSLVSHPDVLEMFINFEF
jgi:hypothetical protein